MAQEVLKKATAGDHKNLETLMYVKQLVDGTLTSDQYMHLIYTNYTVHLLAEQIIFDCLKADTTVKLDITKRTKLTALKKDIAELGMNCTPMLKALPAFELKSEAEALGALYVLEGATLGGQVVLKMLQKNKTVNHLKSAFNYYNVYGNNLSKNWKEFCSVINNLPPESIEEVIAGSKAMYTYFKAVHTSLALSAFNAPDANQASAHTGTVSRGTA